MRWNDPSAWIWSPEPTHEALVSREDWTRAQSVNATGEAARPEASVASVPAPRPRLLRVVRTTHARPDTRRHTPVLPLRGPRPLSRHRRRAPTRRPRVRAAHHRRPRGMARRTLRPRTSDPDRTRDRDAHSRRAPTEANRSTLLVAASVPRSAESWNVAEPHSATPARHPPGARSSPGSTKPQPTKNRPSCALTAATGARAAQPLRRRDRRRGRALRRPRRRSPPGDRRRARRAVRSDRSQRRLRPRTQRGATRGRPRCFNGVSEGGLEPPRLERH